ncbi:hypothetical protein ABH922_001787 [Rhodococcus sp. 27YEA15]
MTVAISIPSSPDPGAAPPQVTDPQHLLLPDEVAALLRTTTEALTARRYRGTGPDFIKVGRSVRYSRAAVTSYLAAGGA